MRIAYTPNNMFVRKMIGMVMVCGNVFPPQYIDIYEVTAGDYEACNEEAECYFSGGGTVTYNLYSDTLDNHPITGVSAQYAEDYCRWKGKRLPTEVEWEKAARGTDGRLYPWGNAAPTCNYAVMHDSYPDIPESGGGCGGLSFTREVGQKPNGVSPYGTHDMAGNAFEWTSSLYDEDPLLRVVRGGSYNSGPSGLESTRRRANGYGDGWLSIFDPLGFRCAQ